MTSPSETLRKKLAKRAREHIALTNHMTPDRLLKSPSQKRSENLRKKLARGTDAGVVIGDDCRDCPKHPCGKTLNGCEEQSRTMRCMKCGVKVHYRFIAGEPYKWCPTCRARG